MGRLIYAADDEQDIREIIKDFLEDAGFEVRTFPTGNELLAAFRENPCDLAVLDIMMPGTNGLDICKALRAISNVPIIILTAREGETDHIRGFMLGGDDYIVKPFSPSLLVVRIKALLRRMDMIRQNSAETEGKDSIVLGDITFSSADHSAMCKGKSLDLTMTEFSLLECLISSPGTAVSRDQLLEKVWGIDEVDIETRVTDETVRRIRQKLKNAGSSTKISAVWGYGYKIEAE